MKFCTGCKEEKSEADFYKHKNSKDGLAWWCKDCDRLQARKSRARHLEAHRAVDRAYYERHKEEKLAKARLRTLKYPYKNAAHVKVREALIKGFLVKQPCEVCGSIDAQAHHDDYSKPLVVRWLCRVHHMRLHHGKSD